MFPRPAVIVYVQGRKRREGILISSWCPAKRVAGYGGIRV
jgi:hypothetical protein